MKPLIHIESSWRSLFKHDEELCGDRVMIRRSEDSFVMVLADGLGSGVKANILSTLTSTIISEMVFSGMPLIDCLETITATLPVCSERQVAYSTFTIIQMFYDGSTHIIEFDNPNAVILRNGRVMHLEKGEIELEGRTIRISQFMAEPEDYIITFSDGILHASTEMELNFDWDQKEIEEFLENEVRPHDHAAEVSRILLANVNYLYGGSPADDSTVAVVHVIPAKETRVMVGPPALKEDDEKVVGRLLSASGFKVCCGGTTSQIVSRVTGKEIRVDTDEAAMRSDVPPKAFINGLDLVTEGVLTLQKVSRYLSRAAKNDAYAEHLALSKEEDGAHSLARVLLNSSGITFMVGSSDNPGHASLQDASVSLDAKIGLIKEMSAHLEELGKIVKIEMY